MKKFRSNWFRVAVEGATSDKRTIKRSWLEQAAKNFNPSTYNKTVRKHKLHFVFLNTKSGMPHVSDFVVRDRFFKAHLKAAGVRYRGPGQCRHTYASQLLTTGVASVDWIAEQMGHTSANMIRQHYGMWINEDGPGVIGMLQHALDL